MKTRILTSMLASAALLAACADDIENGYKPDTSTPAVEVTYDMSGFVKGADVSWITEMEAAGKTFATADGTEMDGMELMRELGCNAIRLRVWVDPADGWCNAQDVAAKALRASKLGFRLMIDFHYSDVWADPANQVKPAAWQGLGFAQLVEAVKTHTTDVLTSLKSLGITPEWVQVGNETGSGMLHDDDATVSGHINYPANYTALNNAGHDAAKAVFPNVKVVVHVQNAFYIYNAQNVFNKLKDNGGKYDVIGLSHYPSTVPESTRGQELGILDWEDANDFAINNIKTLISAYDKDVMIVEYGYDVSLPDEGKACLTDLMARCKAISRCAGIMYWEPQSSNDWKSYALGAFTSDGKPTAAIEPFAE